MATTAEKKTASIFTRVTPQLKEEAEEVLDQLQIPMSTALSMFLQQVVNQKRIPFEVTTRRPPLDYSSLTKEQFDREIQKGFNDFANGNTYTADEVETELRKRRRNL